jgi:predicted hotdog family 3-hydroxylacyl-ACP dehydratase
MCLLDSVESWDDEVIVCRSRSHSDPHNPLRRDGRLSIVHGLEYGAQAIAVHGSLLAQHQGVAPRAGYLAALRDVRFRAISLDDIRTPLDIHSRRLLELDGGVICMFSVDTAGHAVLSARATVVAQSAFGQ